MTFSTKRPYHHHKHKQKSVRAMAMMGIICSAGLKRRICRIANKEDRSIAYVTRELIKAGLSAR